MRRSNREELGNMKFMLMMHYAGEGPPIHTWPPEDIKAHIAFMHRFNKELTESGELVAAEGLAGPDQAKVVRASKSGPPAVTDGPFPEAKEFLAGFWIVDCEGPKRAVEIAARASAAPGFGGATMSIPIELRQVMAGPPED
jgi:hypothetical protein